VQEQKLDLIWGAAAIAEMIGVTQRRAFHLLEAGALPAKKVGGRWVASKMALTCFFEQSEV
jgi:hypothetical protein